MKKCIFLFGWIVLLTGCNYDSEQTITYSVNEPVFMSSDEFRNSVKVSNKAHELGDFGKICFYEGYLYISEPGKGIHIINNTDPARPRKAGYIELLGNFDLTIHNGTLYADAFVDLVWFDVSNPSSPDLKGRLENAFPDALPAIENEYGYDYNLCYPNGEKAKDIVVGWKLKQHTETYIRRGNEMPIAMPDANYGRADKSSSPQGITGSMSRFGLYQNYLYTVIHNYLGIFDLSNTVPKKVTENMYVGYDVETIFSYEDKMFMGTPRGLLIYSVENPTQPTLRSTIWHVYGCDPVVVENNLAYVTVRSGNFCGQSSNELFIMDVSDISQPQQLVSYTMTNPKGLGIDDDVLFLCDDGLKAFKIGNPQTLMSNQLVHYKGMDGYDVIPYNHILMMITDQGLYQYDYSDIKNIKELSVLN